MKNYGNFVMKYVSAGRAQNYRPIYASSVNDYNKSQLADLKRFLEKDFEVPGNRDNYLSYSANVNKQKEEIESEIARLEGQVAAIPKEKK